MNFRPRPHWIVLGTVLASFAVGAVVVLLTSAKYRGEAEVALPGAARPVWPAMGELATSNLLGSNVVQTLRLRESPGAFVGHLAVSLDESRGLVRIRAYAHTADRARQIDAETVNVFLQLVRARYPRAGAPVVLDPAHPAGKVAPRPLRTVGFAALIGGVIGLLGAIGLDARTRVPVRGGEQEARLRRRIKAVTERERALARRAGELAVRERELARHGVVTEAPEPIPRPPGPEPVPPPHPESPAPPQPAEPVPSPLPEPPAAARRYNLNSLEALVAASGPEASGRIEEWNTYLFFLREHAGADGSVPPSFDYLIEDIFAELL